MFASGFLQYLVTLTKDPEVELEDGQEYCPYCNYLNWPGACDTCKHFFGTLGEGGMLPEAFDGDLSDAGNELFELEPDDVPLSEFWAACVALGRRLGYADSLLADCPFDDLTWYLMNQIPLESGNTTITHNFPSDSFETYYIEDWSKVDEVATALRSFTGEIRAALKAGALYTKGDSA